MTVKKFLSTGIAALTAVSLLSSARADITTGLVAHWSLSDGPGSSTVADLSGNANTGTLVNYSDNTYNSMWTTSSDPTNQWPYALTFNQAGEGTDTYVSVPNSASLDVTSGGGLRYWTISAWVKCSVAGGSEPANAGIVAQGVLTGTAYAYCLYMVSGKFTAAFRNNANGGGTSGASVTIPVANTWYHVVGVVSETPEIIAPSTMKSEVWIYVNGVQEYGTNSNTYTTMETSTAPVSIGGFNGGVNPFQGTIDDVRIYSRALTSSDVTQLYNTGANAAANNGIGYWNGLAGSGGHATLDTTSLNFDTNLNSAPFGTPDNLTDLLNVENAASLAPSVFFADSYFNNKTAVAVASTNITITSGGVAVGTSSGAGTVNFLNTQATYTLNSSDTVGLMDGANPTSLVLSGFGTAILTGTNTFSGGTTINSGTLQLGNGGAVTGQETGTSNSVTDNGALSFDGNNSVNFTPLINGSGSVNLIGTGTVTLNGNNTYTGITGLTNGTLDASVIQNGTSSIGAGPFVFGGGTLVYTGATGAQNTSRMFGGNIGTTSTIDLPAGVNLTLTGRVTATNGSATWIINKVDTGTLTLGGTADNSYLGMNVMAGTVILNKNPSATVHAIGGPLTIFTGATVQLGGTGSFSNIFNSTGAPVTINSGGVLDLAGQSNGVANFNLAGTGISSGGALINSESSTIAYLGATYTTLTANSLIGGAGSVTLTGPIYGPGISLTYGGGGTLELQSANDYGNTIVNSGTLDANVTGSIPGNLTVNSGGNLELDSQYAMSAGATLSVPASTQINLNYSGVQEVAALIIGGVSQPAGTYGASANNPGGIFENSGVINVIAPYWDANGTDAGAGNNTLGGGTGSWDNSSGDWWVGGNSDTSWVAGNEAFFAGTAGTVTIGGGGTVAALGLDFLTAGYTINNTDGVSTLSIGGNGGIINIPSGTTTISADLTGGGATTGLTVSGAGTLVLTGTNTYANGTLITNGAVVSVNTIDDSSTSALGTGNITMGGGTLSYNSASPGTTARSITGLTSSADVIDVPGAGSLTLNGAVGGSNFVKTSSGTLILGGTGDNPSLHMAINGGLVIITKTSTANAHGLGGGTSSVASGAELQLSGSGGFDLFDTCVLNVAGGGTFDLNGQSDYMGSLTISGNGSGSGALLNSSSTASVLSNNTGGLVLNGNTTVGGIGNIMLDSVISGSAGITYAGTGVLALTNANTFNGGITVNSGGTVLLTNSATSGGSGSVADAGTLNLGIVGQNVNFNNAISGAGTVNVYQTTGDNFALAGAMSGFTGILNIETSPGGDAKVEIISQTVNLNSVATVNVLAGSTFYLANGALVGSPVNLYGLGNAEVYGALRLESNAVVSGPVTLYGSTTIGNGVATNTAFSTISGPIVQGASTNCNVTFAAVPGYIYLTGTNTYPGPTIINGGAVKIATNGELGNGNYATNITITTNAAAFIYASTRPQTISGTISGAGLVSQQGPGTLTLTGTNSYTNATTITNGSTLVVGGSGVLGATNTVTNYGGTISNYGTFNYSSSAAQIVSGVILGTGNVTMSGSGTLSLSGTDTYTGYTTVGSSTLALASTGSINNTAQVSIAAGATFDVSAYAGSYTLSSAATFNPKGTGSTPGSTAATLKGGANVNINGPLALTYTPAASTGDLTHPSLYVSQGNLSLAAASITVTNASATPLSNGTNLIVQVASGTLSYAAASVNVVGAGVAPGATTSLASTGGNLYLVVSNAVTTLPQPAVTSVSYVGGNITITGTNGSSGGTFHILTSTNVGLPFSQWTTNTGGTFSGTGAFSVPIGVTNSPEFFHITPN